MTQAENSQATDSELVDWGSPEWCEQAVKLWDEVVLPNLADSDNYNYIVEFGETGTGQVSQVRADHGKAVSWESGKRYTDDDCDFLLWASADMWQKIAEGKIDPVGAVASKRLHLRKGPLAVVIKEAEATKLMLKAFGRIPTRW